MTITSIIRPRHAAILRAVVAVLALTTATDAAVGGWTMGNPPPAATSTMLLLTDGSVLAQEYYSNRWFRLRPDASGSYASGTWSRAAAMRDSRLYYASTMLRDGRVFVGGGEYGTGTSSVEVYDPAADQWSVVPGWSGDIGDSSALTLADGRVLLLPRMAAGGSIWDPQSGAWSPVAGKVDGDVNDEESVVRLPDGSLLVVDVWRGSKAQRYVPAMNAWVDAGTIPVNLVDSGYEIGAGLRLPDGRAWFLGATGATAFYLPDAGVWQAGPTLPDGAKADDAPAAVLPNGRVLCIADRGGYSEPSSIVEFDPASGTFAAVPQPWSFANYAAFRFRMLVLPTGQVLLSDGDGHIGVYTSPDGPSDAWRPTIAAVTANDVGTTRIVGTQLNGLDDGAAYGDDAQMASNYPIVRLSANGSVWYARTSTFSTFDIATGARPVSTDVSVAGIPNGTYALEVVANGISSVPTTVVVADGRISTQAVMTRIHLSVDNEYTELYVDGRPLAVGPHANDWTVADDYAVAGNVGTIAVHAINYEPGTNWAALIARIDEADGTTVATDETWRVFVGNPGADAAGRVWYDPNYDDRAWTAPTVIGRLGVSPWGSPAGLASVAGGQWIWPGDYVHGVSPVYLRKHIGVVASSTLRLAVDNRYDQLAINGVATPVGPNDGDWSAPDSYTVAGDITCVALRAINDDPAWGGLLARIQESSGVVVVSDASWRVVVPPPGQAPPVDTAGHRWTDPAYDDSAWSSPTSQGSYGVWPWGKHDASAAMEGAQWIWAGDVAHAVSPIYVRWHDAPRGLAMSR